MKRHSDEVLRIQREVIARREAGESYMQIARCLGVTKGVVAGHIWRHRNRGAANLLPSQGDGPVGLNVPNRAASPREKGSH